jgi:hypothetical protein
MTHEQPAQVTKTVDALSSSSDQAEPTLIVSHQNDRAASRFGAATPATISILITKWG